MALSGEKVPYFVTVLFAAAGWVITHSVDQVVTSPSIEYETQIESGPEASHLLVKVHNITRAVLFKDLVITTRILGHGTGRIRDAWIWPPSPAWEGDDQPEKASQTVKFRIARFQPGWRFTLVTEYTGRATPSFHLSVSSEPVRLIESGMETIFVNHELSILFAALVVWGLLVLLWFLLGKEAANKTEKVELSGAVKVTQ